jgi:hypothetical protein
MPELLPLNLGQGNISLTTSGKGGLHNNSPVRGSRTVVYVYLA